MPLNWLEPRLDTGRQRALYYGVVTALVVVTYFGIKFTLFPSRWMVVNALGLGIALGVALPDRDRSVATAVRAVVLASVTLFVLFVLDDVRMAGEFGVVPGLVLADPGTTVMRVLVFGAYETIIVLPLGASLLLSGLVGAFAGSLLRPYVLGPSGTRG